MGDDAPRDVRETLGELERRLLELERELRADASRDAAAAESAGVAAPPVPPEAGGQVAAPAPAVTEVPPHPGEAPAAAAGTPVPAYGSGPAPEVETLLGVTRARIEALRDSLEGLSGASDRLRETAQTVVEDHGRALVRLERATAAAAAASSAEARTAPPPEPVGEPVAEPRAPAAAARAAPPAERIVGGAELVGESPEPPAGPPAAEPAPPAPEPVAPPPTELSEPTAPPPAAPPPAAEPLAEEPPEEPVKQTPATMQAPAELPEEPVQTPSEPGAEPAGATEGPPEQGRRASPLTLVLLALLVIVLIAVAVWLAINGDGSGESREPAATTPTSILTGFADPDSGIAGSLVVDPAEALADVCAGRAAAALIAFDAGEEPRAPCAGARIVVTVPLDARGVAVPVAKGGGGRTCVSAGALAALEAARRDPRLDDARAAAITTATTRAQDAARADGIAPPQVVRAGREAAVRAAEQFDGDHRLRLLAVAPETGDPCIPPTAGAMSDGDYPLGRRAALLAAEAAIATPEVEQAAIAVRTALSGAPPVSATVLRRG
ncbi:MAG: hypothetical protein LT070_06015 [Solirubrobacteraceae bacterium]|nr:hypothetical protein [Solirubrobacteraceae bacterium]